MPIYIYKCFSSILNIHQLSTTSIINLLQQSTSEAIKITAKAASKANARPLVVKPFEDITEVRPSTITNLSEAQLSDLLRQRNVNDVLRAKDEIVFRHKYSIKLLATFIPAVRASCVQSFGPVAKFESISKIVFEGVKFRPLLRLLNTVTNLHDKRKSSRSLRARCQPS